MNQDTPKSFIIELITTETNLSDFDFTQRRRFNFMNGKILTGYRCIFNNEADFLEAQDITQNDTRYSNLNWKYIIVNHQEKITETRFNLDPLKQHELIKANPIYQDPTPIEFTKKTLLNKDIFYRTHYNIYDLNKNVFVMTKCKITRFNKNTITLKKYNAHIDLTNYTDHTAKEDKQIIFNWKDTLNNYEDPIYINHFFINHLLHHKTLSFIDPKYFCGYSKYSEKLFYTAL